ncbi:RyR domain-containing protein [Streptomyces mirabilis]|uniref:RyR domain-containing protein n=1 Tax=Streptomyces mirabilis TaxID=68239 RepID=UPI0036B19751
MTSAEDIARVVHEANRAFQIVTGDPVPSPLWDDAPDWQRESAVAGVASALKGASPEGLHEEWCDYKRDGGWVYGAEKSADAKTHPCLVPYAELPEDQRRKDALFHAVVHALA